MIESADVQRLSVTDVGKRYGGVVALENVTFTVSAGEVVGLIGPNGAGKTTLVDIITGTQDLDRGEARLDGEMLTGSAVNRSRAGLARTFQHPLISEELTAVENISLGSFADGFRTAPRVLRSFFAGAWGVKSRPDMTAHELLAHDLGLTGLDRVGRDLTLGERRLVEVGRAIATDPSVLLLDEPFAGSDLTGAEGVRDVVSMMSDRNGAVLLVDHNVDLVASIADRIVLLDGGRVVFDGAPRECLASPEMKRVYFG